MDLLVFNVLQSLSEVDTTQVKKMEESAGEAIKHLASTPLNELLPELGEKALNFGLKVLAAIVIYAVGAWIIKAIKNFLKGMFERKKTDGAVASFISSLVSISLTVILILVTVGALGVNTTSIAALLAAGGMAIGMALSGTVQNFAGGIMLMIFKPFKAGDFIVAQGYSGTVTHVSIVSTTLTTVDNRCVVIPNGSLSSGTIDNYSEFPLRRVEWLVDVEYGSDADVVKKALEEIIDADKRVLYVKRGGAPADPFYALNSLKDSSVQFIVRAWTAQTDYWGLYFDINEKIYTELPKKGIRFPFPQMDVHLDQKQLKA